MISSYNLENGLPVFQALASEIRIQILNLISQQDGITPKEISVLLNIPVSTLTPHLHILSDCGLILIKDAVTEHSRKKHCHLMPDLEQLMISLDVAAPAHPVYRAEVPIGSYGSFSVTPTCGLATPTSFIGLLDQPRYFAHPGRTQAEILWFSSGYIEYVLPNFIPQNSSILQISVSMEISSEAPSFNANFPSDISFFLNGTALGTWTSPGDFGDRPGTLNPKWWYPFLNQYGLLKKLTINQQGTFLDDEKLSDVTIRQFSLTGQSLLFFRISVPEDAEHVGGCTLFGKGFGDHRQNIQVEIMYQGNVPAIPPKGFPENTDQ